MVQCCHLDHQPSTKKKNWSLSILQNENQEIIVFNEFIIDVKENLLLF